MSSKEWYETVINLVLYKRSIEPTARNVSWSIERHVVFSDIIIHQQMQNLSDWLLAIYRIVRFLPSRCYCKASAVYVARYMLCLVHPSATRMNFYQNQWRVPLDARERRSCTSNNWGPAFPPFKFHKNARRLTSTRWGPKLSPLIFHFNHWSKPTAFTTWLPHRCRFLV